MSRRSARPAVVTTLLAAAAGVVDLWALLALGGAFAGVVPAALAVGGFAAGAGLAGLLLAEAPPVTG